MLVSGLHGAIDRRALVSASPDQFRSLSDISLLRTPKHRHTAAPASGRRAPSRGECPTLPRDGASYRVSAGSAAQGRFGVGAAAASTQEETMLDRHHESTGRVPTAAPAPSSG